MDRERFDLCVIGAGSGGLATAYGASHMGARVALIEGHRMGGDCLNFGCVPSKALLAAGHAAHAVREAGRFGVIASEPEVDFAAVNAHVRDAIATIEPNDSEERYRGFGVDVIKEHARFVGRDAVRAGARTIRARRFVVATGSRAALPPIPGLDSVPYFTNETLFDNRRETRSPPDCRRRPDRLRDGAGAPAPRLPRDGSRQGDDPAPRRPGTGRRRQTGPDRRRRRTARTCRDRRYRRRTRPHRHLVRGRRQGRDGGGKPSPGRRGAPAQRRRPRTRCRRHCERPSGNYGRRPAADLEPPGSTPSATAPADSSSRISPAITRASSSATPCCGCRRRREPAPCPG